MEVNWYSKLKQLFFKIPKQNINVFLVVIRKHVVISGKTAKKSRFINEGINLHLHVYINKRAYCHAFVAAVGLTPREMRSGFRRDNS